jgi:hypothetical protein
LAGLVDNSFRLLAVPNALAAIWTICGTHQMRLIHPCELVFIRPTSHILPMI